MVSVEFCSMRGIEAEWLKAKTGAQGEHLTSQLSWAAA